MENASHQKAMKNFKEEKFQGYKHNSSSVENRLPVLNWQFYSNWRTVKWMRIGGLSA